MAEAISLNAETRTGKGKGPARQLRLSGRIPAVVYGQGRSPQPLSLSESELEKALAGHASGSTVFALSIDGQSVKALIREVQRHPFKPKILHVDFLEIHAGQKVTLEVPIHLVGVAEGVKNQGGVMDQVLREVEIEVLPKDIPEHIEVDVSALHVGESLHVSDLQIPEAEILTEAKKTICTVVPPRVEAEPEVVVEAEEEELEPELIRKAKEEDEEEAEAGED